MIVCCACASLYLLQAVAAGCDNAAWEVWDIGCALQVARGKVKKGRCEAICSSKSGRFLYLGWDNADAGFLMMADTFRPDVVQKVRSDYSITEDRAHTHPCRSGSEWFQYCPQGAGQHAAHCSCL